MTPKVFLILMFALLMGVAGQYFFKSGMNTGPVEFGPQVVLCFFRPKVFIGLCFYVISTVGWLAILSQAPLSVVYPCISISYIFVVIMGQVAFNEQPGLSVWGGVALICAGVALIGLGNHRHAPVPQPVPAVSTAMQDSHRR